MLLPPGKAGETAKVPWHPTHACLVTRVAPGRCANQADPRIALDSSERLDWRTARQIKATKTSAANPRYASASTSMAAGSAGETGEPASTIARRAKLEPKCATGTSAPIARIPMRAAIAWTVLARCQAATAKQIENHGVICCQA